MCSTRQSNRLWLLPVVSVLLLLGTLANGCAPGPGEAVDDLDRLPGATALPEQDVADRQGWPRIVALGDSLTAGLGLSADEAYPARLQERLDAAGYQLRVVNAGTSGDTTAGGLRRLEFALEGESDVAVLIVALGGNDGLRGLAVDQMRENLSRIIGDGRQRGARVLLAGMEAPPNFGREYTEAFRQVFVDMAAEHDVAFVPFLLEGVAGVADLNQSDGIHPNAEGAERVAAHLWPVLRALLEEGS